MPIKAIAIDIDGTLTDYENLLDWSAVPALRRAEKRGIPVIVASGNIAPVAKTFTRILGLTGPIVCENGGAVYSNDMTRSKILFSRKRPDRAVAFLRRKGFDMRRLWSDPWRQSEVALPLNLDEAQVREALKNWNLSVVGTSFALHISEHGLDKLEGLQEALRFLPNRTSVKDVLAIGDSNNDVRMLRGCGHSGCVGNGKPLARDAAQYVARSHHGRGVAEILRHFGLA